VYKKDQPLNKDGLMKAHFLLLLLPFIRKKKSVMKIGCDQRQWTGIVRAGDFAKTGAFPNNLCGLM
jgi:hypothetical protein